MAGSLQCLFLLQNLVKNLKKSISVSKMCEICPIDNWSTVRGGGQAGWRPCLRLQCAFLLNIFIWNMKYATYLYGDYTHYTDYTHVWCTRTQCCIRRLENPRKIFTAVKTVDVCCRVVSGLRSTKVKDKFAYHHSWHTSIRAKQALNSGRLRFGPVWVRRGIHAPFSLSSWTFFWWCLFSFLCVAVSSTGPWFARI